MAEFLAELYVPRGDAATVGRSLERARLAADELRAGGRSVRHVRSIFVPEDETCYLLYEAATRADVEEATRRAQIRVERIAESVGC